MEDIIDIIVTETTNTIEITAQPNDEIIDVNIIDNREDIVLNVTPSVVEININSLVGNFGVNWGQIGGTLSNQTDLNTALGLKADLVGGKVPSSQLPSYVDDVIEVANFASLPATGETGKIYITLDTNFMYRWSGATYIEIKDSSAVWGAITGTLSSQIDLQNALNAKFDDPTGDTTQYIAGDGSLVTFPIAGQAGTLVREIRNTTGATLTKGTIIYISGATGNKPTVSKAIATGDSTSAQTFGMCQANIANNSNGYVVCVGDLSGLDTNGLTEGAQLYLSSTTAGAYTTTKQLAPAHLVYIGIVTRAHPTLGQIEVNIQNGYELYELHDVSITSEINNQGLFYESSTDLWKNKSIATALGYTPADDALVVKLAGSQTITGTKTFQQAPLVDIGVGFKDGNGLYNVIKSLNTGWEIPVNQQNHKLLFSRTTNYDYTFPNASGTIALTSDLGAYLPLAGGTMTGAIVGTTATFANSGSGIGLGVTLSGASGDGVKITHSAGRAFNIQSSGSGFGILINNETASTSAPFTIQKQGLAVITLTDAGAGSFASSLTASSFVKSGGTSSQFLKADGSVDSTSYQPTLTNPVTGTGTSGILPKFTGTSTIGNSQIYDNGTRVSIGADVTTSSRFVSVSSTSGAYAIIAQASSGANGIFSTALGSGEIFRGQNSSGAYFIINNSANTFLSGNLNVGDFASTSFRLNVVGTANFTGALSGTSATFTGNLGVGIVTPNARLQVSNGNNNASQLLVGESSTFGSPSIRFQPSGINYMGLGFTTGSTIGNEVLDAIAIQRTGNVGIGLINPQANLHVYASNGSGLAVGQNLTNTALSANIFLYPSSTASTKRNWAITTFYDRDELLQIRRSSTTTSNPYDNGTTIMTFDGVNDRVGIGTISPSSKLHVNGGLRLQGGSSDLTYYEEGTWTPVVNKLSSSPSVTYSYREGTYTRIGNLVHAFFDISASSITGGSGSSSISGLPFTVSNSQAGFSVAQWRDSGAIASGALNTVVKGFANRGTNYIYIQIDNTGITGFGNNTEGAWNTSGRVTGYIVYQA